MNLASFSKSVSFTLLIELHSARMETIFNACFLLILLLFSAIVNKPFTVFAFIMVSSKLIVVLVSLECESDDSALVSSLGVSFNEAKTAATVGSKRNVVK